MYIHRKAFIISLFALLMMSAYVDVHYVAAQTNIGQSSLEAASNVIHQAFNRMLAAERSGANVTGLVDKLNGAVNLLAEAENAYRIGTDNITTIEEKTDAAVFIARQVTSESQIALEKAQNSVSTRFWLALVLIAIGILILGLVLFTVWRFIKRSYIKDLIESEPGNRDET